jgi:hypothetical protein
VRALQAAGEFGIGAVRPPEEARRISATEGVALNQFINVAVAEKLSALRTEKYLRDRAPRGESKRRSVC